MNAAAHEIVKEIAPDQAGELEQRRPALSGVAAFLQRMMSLASTRRRERRLRLREMLPLGEKRFVAVVEYGSEEFLLAGTPQNISLLRRLEMNRQGAEETPVAGATQRKDSRQP
jgi:flagellar biogenesis protein FliO